MLGFLIAAIVLLYVFACLGRWMSQQRHRPAREGFLLGLFLGPLGLILAGLMPALPAPVKPGRF